MQILDSSPEVRGLDPNTLRAIARLICGNSAHGGEVPSVGYQKGQTFEVPSHYRQAPEIKQLFIDAAEGSDGDIEALFSAGKESKSSKYNITLQALKEFCNSSEGLDPRMERLLCNLAAPREYVRNPELAPLVLNFLNNELGFEGYELHLENGVRPVMKPLAAQAPLSEELGGAPPFKSVVKDAKMLGILNETWEELARCHKAEAYMASMLFVSSILEGLLQERASRDPGKIKAAPRMRGNPKSLEDWPLDDLIAAAVQCGWLKADRERNFQHAREIRNLVHPRKREKDSFRPDRSTVAIAIEVIKGAVVDLSSA